MRFKEGDNIILGTHVYGRGCKYKGKIGTFVRYSHDGIVAFCEETIKDFGNTGCLTFMVSDCKPCKEYNVKQILIKIDENDNLYNSSHSVTNTDR